MERMQLVEGEQPDFKIQLVNNYDTNLQKIVDLILVEKIKKDFLAAGSWQKFKLQILAKKDSPEQIKFDWMCSFYVHHKRLEMLDIDQVLLNQNLLISQNNQMLKLDIIQLDLRARGASQPEKLAKDLKDFLNDARKLIKSRFHFQPVNIYEELLPQWITPSFSNEKNYAKYTLLDIGSEIDQIIGSIYDHNKMNQEISDILIRLHRIVASSPLKDNLRLMMPTFSLYKEKWISQAVGFINCNALYDLYDKEGGT